MLGIMDADELKGVISRTLEAKGVLAKIRAELRKHVFEAIDEQEQQSAEPEDVCPQLTSIKSTALDSTALDLVKEFLSFYELDYTLSVLTSEARLKASTPANKKKLADQLSLPIASARPLLVELLASKSSTALPLTASPASLSPKLSTQAREEQKIKEHHDRDAAMRPAPKAVKPATSVKGPPLATNNNRPHTPVGFTLEAEVEEDDDEINDDEIDDDYGSDEDFVADSPPPTLSKLPASSSTAKPVLGSLNKPTAGVLKAPLPALSSSSSSSSLPALGAKSALPSLGGLGRSGAGSGFGSGFINDPTTDSVNDSVDSTHAEEDESQEADDMRRLAEIEQRMAEIKNTKVSMPSAEEEDEDEEISIEEDDYEEDIEVEASLDADDSPVKSDPDVLSGDYSADASVDGDFEIDFDYVEDVEKV